MKNRLHPALLALENGTIYQGWSLIKDVISLGEVVFNTGMTGYQEIITDPSYCGQIITFTYPEIGNTGINNEDNECNSISIKGIIAKNICFQPSNWRKQKSFTEYIINNNIPHIFGIDTRALTKNLRQNGSMNGCIVSQNLNKSNILNMIKNTISMEGNNLVNEVTTDKPYQYMKLERIYKSYIDLNINATKPNSQKLTNIILIDLGVKQNIIERLLSYGCQINVVPATTTPQIIASYKPDGIVLSNGPGDPSAIPEIIHNIKILVETINVPIFGICMGHQILSLAFGGKTFKLKFGHRGINHPAGIGNKTEITSQNHGFAVQVDSINDKDIYITHLNLNDSTIAGLIHKNKPIFSVQYHPEASPGPHDSDYLFQYFINLVNLVKSNNQYA